MLDKLRHTLKENLRFNGKYFLSFLGFLGIEILIALFIQDGFIRYYIGDVLVILVMYTLIKSFVSAPTKRLPYHLFGFAVVVEFSQLFNLATRLNLDQYPLVRIILGSTFDLNDIISYGVGALILVVWEQLLRKDISYL
jgi:hypothetical protein